MRVCRATPKPRAMPPNGTSQWAIFFTCVSHAGPPLLAHLLCAAHEIHEAIVVVVVVRALGGVDWQHEVVASQPVALRVLVGKDAGLQHLVVTVADACGGRRGEIESVG